MKIKQQISNYEKMKNEMAGVFLRYDQEKMIQNFLPLILLFWDSDEDFPASLQILVDENILDYMHYKIFMFAISHLLNLLKEES